LDRIKGNYYFNLFLNLMRANYMKSQKDWEKVANEVGLTHTQQHALWILHLDNGLTLDELGNIAFWNKSTTSALVSRLEKKGYVRKERYLNNTRTIRIYITDKGKKILEDSVNTERAVKFMGLLRSLDVEEIEKFLETLEKIYDLMNNQDATDFKNYLQVSSNMMLKL
jgi:DNA-binding MarR family transcriptional regulator